MLILGKFISIIYVVFIEATQMKWRIFSQWGLKIVNTVSETEQIEFNKTCSFTDCMIKCYSDPLCSAAGFSLANQQCELQRYARVLLEKNTNSTVYIRGIREYLLISFKSLIFCFCKLSCYFFFYCIT